MWGELDMLRFKFKNWQLVLRPHPCSPRHKNKKIKKSVQSDATFRATRVASRFCISDGCRRNVDLHLPPQHFGDRIDHLLNLIFYASEYRFSWESLMRFKNKCTQWAKLNIKRISNHESHITGDEQPQIWRGYVTNEVKYHCRQGKRRQWRSKEQKQRKLVKSGCGMRNDEYDGTGESDLVSETKETQRWDLLPQYERCPSFDPPW